MDAKNGIRKFKQILGGDKCLGMIDNFLLIVSEWNGIHSSAIGLVGYRVGDVKSWCWPIIYVANDVFWEGLSLYELIHDGTYQQNLLDNLIFWTQLGSMGVDIADLNNDGYSRRLFVTEMLRQWVKLRKSQDAWFRQHD